MKNPLKILVVDDSAVVRDFLSFILNSEEDMLVVGTAKNGEEAIRMVESRRPDLITMDIQMPVMNGLEATRIIMESHPMPIIIITSSYDPHDVNKTFHALETGALAVLPKPEGFNHPDFPQTKKELLQTIRLMSEIKVVTRRNRYKDNIENSHSEYKPKKVSEEKYKLIAIGVSTGGPQVLHSMIPQLPENFNLPIVIVQHIAEGFLEGMVEWLDKTSKLNIKIAEHGEVLKKGNVYFCPTEFNIGIKGNLTVELTDETAMYSIVPSVSYLFRSVNKNFRNQAIGVLLTGMGKDGAEELAMMKESGALTIVQDKESCIVYGMPGEAVNLNAHKYILSPHDIVKKLLELNKHSK